MCKKLSKQEIFDRVWDHFLVQKKPPSIRNTRQHLPVCMYRLDGTAACPVRCAAGLFMDDAKYDPKFEGKALGWFTNDVLEQVFPAVDWTIEDMMPFMRTIQFGHDSIEGHAPSEGRVVLESSLRATATRFNLTCPEAKA